MRDVAKCIRGTLASRREANRPPPGNVILAAALSGVIAERANHGLPVVTLGTERLIDGDGAPIRVFEDERAAAILFVGSTPEPSPGAALLASEPDFPRLPFAEDGIFDAESGTVLETLPFAGRQAGPRLNGDAVHNTHPPGSRHQAGK